MKDELKFERMVLLLTVGALCIMAVWLLVRRQDTSVQWRVEVERGEDPASSLPEEDGWPDSLLEGEVININTASVSDLQRLPGIGPERAQVIVDYRQEQGGFSSVEELMRVDGIGKTVLERLRPYVSAQR